MLCYTLSVLGSTCDACVLCNKTLIAFDLFKQFVNKLLLQLETATQ